MFLDDQVEVMNGVSPDCLPLAQIVGDLLSGGKRLRAAFCYWGWRGAGGPDGDEIVSAAAALELFQAAALIHDDVMDDSDTRRGMPAVHVRFAELHRDQGWQGGSDRFGLAGALLAGDLCLSWCSELFFGSGVSAEALTRGRGPLDRMRTQLMAGQYLDMLEQANPTVADSSVSRSRRVIRYKSAKYTVEEPLLIGAALAGASPRLQAGYAAYGLPLGEAFQLRDDVLGVFGDPEQTGKPAGDDLREGKRTMLVAEALAAAGPAQADEIHRLLGDPDLDADGVQTLRTIIQETGALDAVEALVGELVQTSRSALQELPRLGIDGAAHEVLTELVEAATARCR